MMKQLRARAVRTRGIGAQGGRKWRVVEAAIPCFLKKAVAGHEAENSIQRRLMSLGGSSQVFDWLRLAGLDEIGNAELGDCADRAAEGSAVHDAGKVFGFLLGHEFHSIPQDGGLAQSLNCQ